MPGQRPILAMGFVASLGITFVVLACHVPRGEGPNFWPLLVTLFYILLPIPMTISQRAVKDSVIGMMDVNPARYRDFALFLSAGIMVSSAALPIVLSRAPVEKPIIAGISCLLVEIGNALCLMTMGLFYAYFKPVDGF